MRVLTTDGNIITLSPTQNTELFKHVVGGYGLFGIILDAELEITENTIYESTREIIDYKDFNKYFNEKVEQDKNIGLFYAHLSTSKNSLLKEVIIYSYKTAKESETLTVPPLTEVSSVKLRRWLINNAKKSSFGREFKWFAEKYIEPKIETCSITRNQAMKDGEACLVARNEPMHDSVPYLKNNLKDETDILQEYFIPRENFIPFVDGLRNIVNEQNVSLLNASVRVVHKEDIALNYAPQEAFAIVLYINQKTNVQGSEKMTKTTKDLIDLTQRLGGRFFLPYQLHYTSEQLHQNYPEIDAFFATKKKYDPQQILVNTWYQKYKTQ
jgi:FAD/FMN-containing dehydrogenase